MRKMKYSLYVGPQGKSFKFEFKLHGDKIASVFFG